MRVCRPLFVTLLARTFSPLFITMCNYNYAPGAVHLDIHHNSIALMPSMIRDLVHSFASNAAPNDVAEVVDVDEIPNEELFHYIHYAITSPKERVDIHKQVCNIVRLPKMQLICDELYDLMKQRKVLCSINPDAMLEDLKRLGLPSSGQSGFSDKNFYRCYRTPKFG